VISQIQWGLDNVV